MCSVHGVLLWVLHVCCRRLQLKSWLVLFMFDPHVFSPSEIPGKFSAGVVIAALLERIDGRERATLGRCATRSPASNQRVPAAARSTRFFTTNSPSMVRMGKLGRKAVCGEENTTLKVPVRCSTAEAAVHLLHTPASNISPMASSDRASAL